MDFGENPKRVIIHEVGLRDGLQNEAAVLSPEIRTGLIERLVDAGLPAIQIGSFVNPRLVPQMAGTDLVWTSLRKREGVRYGVLVLSERGLNQALDAGIPHLDVYVSASETHSRRNSNMSVDEALSAALAMVDRAVSAGADVTAGVMCAFGCFYEGHVPVGKVIRIVDDFRGRGISAIALADTTGMGTPESVRTLIRMLGNMATPESVELHLHDTRGLGMVNLLAALEMGVRRFDSSVAGLGGCPFIPGAAGNISTERTVEELSALGYPTGVDVEKVRAIGRDLEKLLGRSPAEPRP